MSIQEGNFCHPRWYSNLSTFIQHHSIFRRRKQSESKSVSMTFPKNSLSESSKPTSTEAFVKLLQTFYETSEMFVFFSSLVFFAERIKCELTDPPQQRRANSKTSSERAKRINCFSLREPRVMQFNFVLIESCFRDLLNLFHGFQPVIL